jgi:hypothetical protein
VNKTCSSTVKGILRRGFKHSIQNACQDKLLIKYRSTTIWHTASRSPTPLDRRFLQGEHRAACLPMRCGETSSLDEIQNTAAHILNTRYMDCDTKSRNNTCKRSKRDDRPTLSTDRLSTPTSDCLGPFSLPTCSNPECKLAGRIESTDGKHGAPRPSCGDSRMPTAAMLML